MILDKIKKPNDIKKVKRTDYPLLAAEIRKFLIEQISKTGGHLASNLGVVELTMALHIVLNLPKDKIIWDVGHQAYTHKILTGRMEDFNYLRKFGGISGFPKRDESSYDAFDTGHSTTSISAGLGYAIARDITKDDYKVVSVIGDGSLTGGMAYEALNNIDRVKGNFIIVLNDNNMSISNNVGSISNILNDLRTSSKYREIKGKVKEKLKKLPNGENLTLRIRKTKAKLRYKLTPGQIIEAFGLTYYGPIDGHDMNQLIRTLRTASKLDGPAFVHVFTKKGKGYAPAEDHAENFHGVQPFIIETGEPKKKKKGKSYANIFSEQMCELGGKYEKLVAITAAMPSGVGLVDFSKEFPDRYYDVGIAEEHAVTFAAGLSAAGMTPVFAVYSSFLQRAYDQLIHDVCIQNLKVIIAVEHAGLVGSDGETHQGIFDISFLSSIPGMTVFAPKNANELRDVLNFAVEKMNGPIAIRYPSGTASEVLSENREPIILGRSEVIYREKDIAIFAVGRMVDTAVKVRDRLKEQGYNVTLVNARFVKPLDTKLISELARTHKLIVTMEENVKSGGYGEHVCEYVMSHGIRVRVLPIALPNEYIEHGDVNILFHECRIDEKNVFRRIEAEYLHELHVEEQKTEDER